MDATEAVPEQKANPKNENGVEYNSAACYPRAA